jgi:GxxExxY protein
MSEQIIIDLETLYAATGTAKLAQLAEYETRAKEIAGNGNVITLTGQAPIWLYLRIAHALHGKARTLRYDSPVTGEVTVYDHSPFEIQNRVKPEPQRREDRKELPLEELGNLIIGAAIQVHRQLGPGLLESAYQKCLSHELMTQGIGVLCEQLLPISYNSVEITSGYRVDMMVEGSIVIENKTVERALPIHEAQLLTYLKMTGCKLGFLINWNVPVLKDGLKRMVNKL